MANYSDAYALCPFYIADSREQKNITCEGVTDDNYLKLSFGKNPQAREQYKAEFCEAKYKTCRIYKMLLLKYEDA